MEWEALNRTHGLESKRWKAGTLVGVLLPVVQIGALTEIKCGRVGSVGLTRESEVALRADSLILLDQGGRDMLAGYCWPQSGRSGDEIALHVSGEGECVVRIVRVGKTEQEVATKECAAVRQGVPQDAASAGCRWLPALHLKIEPHWPSGFYRVDLSHGADRAEAFFVVKAPVGDTSHDGILVLSTSTWAAYNDWGGDSFYTGGHTVSQDRPLPRGFLKKEDPRRLRNARFIEFTEADRAELAASRLSGWSMSAGWANWEQLFVEWAEQQGLQLAYGVSQDLVDDADLLRDSSLYISVGHDEYWCSEMRDRVESYVEAGGNALFLSGNTSFWQARYEGDCWVSYKMEPESDPMFDADGAPALSTMWSDPLVGRPENHMTGVSFTRGGYANMPNSPAGGGYTLVQPEHWAFDGVVDLKAKLGEVSKVVGYECDGCEFVEVGGRLRPTGYDGTPSEFEILAIAPARLWETQHLPDNLRDDYVGELNWVTRRLEGEDSAANLERYGKGHAVMGTMRKGRGQVFTVGCTDWAYGLDEPAVAQVTRNVIRAFSVRSVA